MNRGLNGLPSSTGSGLNGLGDVVAGTARGASPAYDVATRRFKVAQYPKWDAGRGLYNYRPDKVYKLRAQLAKVRLGTGDAKIMCIGDSTTYGTGATTTDKSWPHQMGSYFSGKLGITGSTQFDWQQSVASRWSLPTGWAGAGGMGQFLQGQTTASGPLTYTPPESFDNFTIYYLRNSGLGTSNVNVDGGSTIASMATAGAISVQSQSFACTLGAHTINIAVPTGGTMNIFAIDAWDSTTKKARVYNAGVGSQTSASFLPSAGNQWAYGKWRAILTPDLTIVALGINDNILGSVNMGDFYRNMGAIITDAQLSGDVILASILPFATSTNVSKESEFSDVVFQLADDYDLPLIDLRARMVSLAAETTYFGASGHLNDTGCADYASAVLNALALAC